MRHVRLPAPVLRATAPLLRTWWKIRQPSTFGVKVLLLHPAEPGRFLVVRHSYSDPNRWGLPGGGYRPSRETPQEAASREIAEELTLTAAPGAFVVLETLETTLEAKRDTLTILRVLAPSTDVVPSPELAEARWISSVEELGDAPVSCWLTRALAHKR
ncbi:NUDIX domain-containing protein [Glycomyces sp. A-F 0318]|uniref:NUDIX domain-containing protein n=1 Tax=Glycomyces amatae TaxID=2881355 RepID=UPI001E49C736|nr:NUDIX domain-containing protein [Glycomyces amatae]MCD0443756.1 NUDIX domain-containing protein [Glycomyces amatae]